MRIGNRMLLHQDGATSSGHVVYVCVAGIPSVQDREAVM